MLLRRVIQHFRNQEWTAVAIDLVIVVVGVYIGIQAQSWSNERENLVIEERYLSDLRAELEQMMADGVITEDALVVVDGVVVQDDFVAPGNLLPAQFVGHE